MNEYINIDEKNIEDKSKYKSSLDSYLRKKYNDKIINIYFNKDNSVSVFLLDRE